MGMNGLIVLQPHANRIADGTKTEEYRSRPPPFKYLKQDIYLLSECKILAIIQIIDYVKFSETYYIWKIKLVEEYTSPHLYEHPRGAQTWVKDVNYTKTTMDEFQ